MPFEIPEGLMVSVSGVRGRVGEALTPDVITRFGAAFGVYLRQRSERPAVVVGRDSRASGPMVVGAVTAALQAVGCDVVDVGLVPTPTALLAVEHHRADGGIVATASHNPVEWNALKLASDAGMFLDAEQGRALREVLDRDERGWVLWDAVGGHRTDGEAVRRHLEAVLALSFVDVSAIRARRFRVALDCVRGAGGVLLSPLLESLGCEVVGLHLEPDGRFPRDPEPVAGNLGELVSAVRESEADLGLATDPDGDRLAVVDERGRAIGEDRTLALAARMVLRHRPGPVVANLSTSQVVEDVARDFGVAFHRAAVGEINVARRMEREGAVIGGEGNGGVILPEVHHTRDAAVATVLILALMAETEQTISALIAGPDYQIVKSKLPRSGGSLEPVYTWLEEAMGAPVSDRQDGLWLAWPEERRWLHFRPSGTEPIVRIIAEAPDRDAAEGLADKVRRAVASG